MTHDEAAVMRDALEYYVHELETQLREARYNAARPSDPGDVLDRLARDAEQRITADLNRRIDVCRDMLDHLECDMDYACLYPPDVL